jgi:hypothetical protein
MHAKRKDIGLQGDLFISSIFLDISKKASMKNPTAITLENEMMDDHRSSVRSR